MAVEPILLLAALLRKGSRPLHAQRGVPLSAAHNCLPKKAVGEPVTREFPEGFSSAHPSR